MADKTASNCDHLNSPVRASGAAQAGAPHLAQHPQKQAPTEEVGRPESSTTGGRQRRLRRLVPERRIRSELPLPFKKPMSPGRREPPYPSSPSAATQSALTAAPAPRRAGGCRSAAEPHVPIRSNLFHNVPSRAGSVRSVPNVFQYVPICFNIRSNVMKTCFNVPNRDIWNRELCREDEADETQPHVSLDWNGTRKALQALARTYALSSQR